MNDSNDTEDILLREDQEGAVYLTLNRPDKFNTLSEAMLARLQEELDAIAGDPAVRCGDRWQRAGILRRSRSAGNACQS